MTDRYVPNANPNTTTERRNDPQIVLTGILKEGERSDVIVFKFEFMLVEVSCIVTIPSQGTTSAPVYLKFRIKR